MKNNIREMLIDLLEQADGQVNNDIPSLEMIADYLIANGVVPVVRCKDCKHYKKINYDDISQNTCEITTKRQQPYDYCSYGERRDNK